MTSGHTINHPITPRTTLRTRGGLLSVTTLNRTTLSQAVYALIQTVKTIFQMQTAVCKFEPSCSVYAKEAVRTLPLHIAAIKIFWRVLRCNPFSKGGFDPISRKG